jgi:RNA-directed DNA polymerase
MIEQVLKRKNLYKAYRQVVRNKGASGVDNMTVDELFSYLENNRNHIIKSTLNKTYIPKPIRGVEIPKSNEKTRLLGIPTVIDRWLQQAISQVLSSKFELGFEEHSYGFRPAKNIHKAVTQSLTYINSGYRSGEPSGYCGY